MSENDPDLGQLGGKWWGDRTRLGQMPGEVSLHLFIPEFVISLSKVKMKMKMEKETIFFPWYYV